MPFEFDEPTSTVVFQTCAYKMHAYARRFLEPITYGDYPLTMRSLVGKRLPKFTEDESQQLKGSFDFVGLNYYTANYAKHAPTLNNLNPSYTTDAIADLLSKNTTISIAR